jgi:quinol monooxygenase YgiN
MLIIAGKMMVHPDVRDKWVEDHRDAITRARAFPGCLDLYLSADPLEEGRINFLERWESEEDLAAWRAVANPPPQPDPFEAEVYKYEIAAIKPPFDR